MIVLDRNPDNSSLLSPSDPNPVECIAATGRKDVLLVCEHAGNSVPHVLGDLGLTQAQLNSHIGWDIGADNVARSLAETLGCAAILQSYSRLIIDCNRPPGNDGSVPDVSDGVSIPANHQISDGDRARRETHIFRPFDEAILAYFQENTVKLALSIHSFTPSMDGQSRPWDIGLLFRQDIQTSTVISEFLNTRYPELNIALNEPYQIDDASDWFIPKYAEQHNIAHCLIEVRNDHLLTKEGCEQWAQILANAISHIADQVTP